MIKAYKNVYETFIIRPNYVFTGFLKKNVELIYELSW